VEHLAAGSQTGCDDLARQVRDLNQRVHILEERLAITASPVTPQVEAVAAEPLGASLEDETTRVIPVFGRALLAVAGAYLLRALAENHVVRLEICLAAGILYALFWLWMAARTASEQKLVAGVHGLTSVLVLAPLLWEATVRFHALPSWVPAAVLWFFCVFGLAISWKRNLAIVAWITTLAGLITASALLMATKDLVPFTFALLAMAAAVEFSACLEHWLRERWIVALFADAAVLLLSFIASRPDGVPAAYVPISVAAALSAQALLLLIYLASIIVRTMVRGITFTSFESAQCVMAFVLCLGGALNIAHGHPVAFTIVSVFCLVCGMACYLVSFVFLEGHGRHDRNFYTYSFFGLVLITGGTWLLLPPATVTFVWSVLALSCLYVGGRTRRTTLDAHGGAYLTLAAIFSGWLLWPARILLESSAGPGPLNAAHWFALASAIPAYIVMLRHKPAAEWIDKAIALGVGAYAVWILIGVAAAALHFACGPSSEDTLLAAFCPTALTALLTAVSVGLAWARERFDRPELSLIVFPVMVLAAYKLLFVDFRGTHTLALFASLLFFGGTLVLLPRLMHRHRTP
jgi:hypothetical protein